MEKYEQELKDLQDVMYAMELRFTEREKAAQQEFQGVVDELKNKVSGMKDCEVSSYHLTII